MLNKLSLASTRADYVSAKAAGSVTIAPTSADGVFDISTTIPATAQVQRISVAQQQALVDRLTKQLAIETAKLADLQAAQTAAVQAKQAAAKPVKGN